MNNVARHTSSFKNAHPYIWMREKLELRVFHYLYEADTRLD